MEGWAARLLMIRVVAEAINEIKQTLVLSWPMQIACLKYVQWTATQSLKKFWKAAKQSSARWWKWRYLAFEKAPSRCWNWEETEWDRKQESDGHFGSLWQCCPAAAVIIKQVSDCQQTPARLIGEDESVVWCGKWGFLVNELLAIQQFNTAFRKTTARIIQTTMAKFTVS
jgi:hypothetical protein